VQGGARGDAVWIFFNVQDGAVVAARAMELRDGFHKHAQPARYQFTLCILRDLPLP
jgi:hypothetical protein